MNWAWAASLDQIWRSPNLPLWLTLAVAGIFGIVVLITLLRAERSAANTTLALITLLAIAVAGVMTIRGFGAGDRSVAATATETRLVQATATLPQLSCIDDLAGDAVLSACEKVLFGSAESVAAAVAYAASQITLLTSLGDVATANKGAGPDVLALRRAIEQDRYGLVAYVLTTRERCTPSNCRAFRSLTDSRQIAANMNERAYENLIMRYAGSWNAPTQPASGLVAALPASVPTGKPTNAEFPTSASTPPVSIMTPEPAGGPKQPAQGAAAPAAPAAPRPAAATPPASTASTTSPVAQAAAKKPPAAPKRPSNAAPVQLAPSAPATSDNE